MSPTKTYLLAPTFQFLPHGPISIGNIIADPFKPHRVLTSADPVPAIETVRDADYAHRRDGSHGLEASVWAHFLQTVGVDLSAQYEQGVATEHTMECLETSYLKFEPGEEEIQKRVQDPRVQTVMKSGILRPQPVYMISGVKIAKGFSASREVAARKSGKVGVSVPISAEASVGTDSTAFKSSAEREAFRAEGDRVYAYQLLKIANRGWRKKVMQVEDYYPKAAFLSNDSDGEDEDQLGPMNAAPASVADLSEENRERMSLTMVEIQEGQERCMCISFNEQ